MEEYLSTYGYHFNGKLFEFAVSEMRDHNGNKLSPWGKEKVEQTLRNAGVTLKHNKGHDAAYVMNMAIADYWGGLINKEDDLAKFVRDYLDDPDGSESKAFDHFWIDCVAKGTPIFWDEML